MPAPFTLRLPPVLLRLRPHLPTLCLLLILATTALFIRAYYFPGYYSGVDESSYLVSAKSFATTGSFGHVIADPFHFASENMVETAPGVFYTKYPPGYPFLCAIAYRLGGPDAPFLVNPILALITLVAFYFLAKEFLSPWAAVFATLLLAANPLVYFYAVRPMSHATDLCFSTLAMLFLWRSYKYNSILAALLTGLFIAAAASTRYTDLLLILPAGALFVYKIVTTPAPSLGKKILRSPLLLIIASLVAGLIPLAIYHTVAFGSPFATGYSLTAESSSFSLTFFVQHFLPMLGQINSPRFGLVLIFPIAIVALIFLARRATPEFLFLALWALVPLLLYSAYYWIGPPALYLRFILNTYPAYILAALAIPFRLLPASRLSRLILPIAAIPFAAFAFAAHDANVTLDEAMNMAAFTQEMGRLCHDHLPPNTVLLADQYIAYYLDYAADYDLYYPHYFNEAWVHKQLDDQADPHSNHNLNALRASRLNTLIGQRDNNALTLLLRERFHTHLAQGRPVAILCPTVALEYWQQRLGPSFQFTLLATSEMGWTLCSLSNAPSTQPHP